MVETERLLMRQWRSGDVETYAHTCADPRNAASRRLTEKAGLTLRKEARWRGYNDV